MYKLIFFLLLTIPIAVEHVVIDKGIYKAWYSPKLEQPIKVSYLVLNRPNIVGREDMKFYEETNIHTSNNKDYYNNEWDKGHMAPAIHFSDSVENLKATYSYVNSALQHMNLNRGAWRDLETAVRGWAENETLFIENNILFEEGTERSGSSELNHEKREGSFHCANCGVKLFDSKTKYESGSGWPSFYESLPDVFETKTDHHIGYARTEYHCKKCGGHHGHIFDDGPEPTGKRFCNNGVCLVFKPKS